MGKLSFEIIGKNKINDKYQTVVNYCGSEMVITAITEKNIMLKQISKLNRGNCGRYNSGRYRIKNDENATNWYLENRIIQ